MVRRFYRNHALAHASTTRQAQPIRPGSEITWQHAFAIVRQIERTATANLEAPVPYGVAFATILDHTPALAPLLRRIQDAESADPSGPANDALWLHAGALIQLIAEATDDKPEGADPCRRAFETLIDMLETLAEVLDGLRGALTA
jgi:hypothetical protein